jgi:hypothetical protein
MKSLHRLAVAYQAIPAGDPSVDQVMEKLPALYSAIDGVLSETSHIGGLLATVERAEAEGLTVHVATRATCQQHIAAGDDRP